LDGKWTFAMYLNFVHYVRAYEVVLEYQTRRFQLQVEFPYPLLVGTLASRPVLHPHHVQQPHLGLDFVVDHTMHYSFHIHCEILLLVI